MNGEGQLCKVKYYEICNEHPWRERKNTSFLLSISPKKPGRTNFTRGEATLYLMTLDLYLCSQHLVALVARAGKTQGCT
jgi:hypothetical protein